jgi:hypothetical protein
MPEISSTSPLERRLYCFHFSPIGVEQDINEPDALPVVAAPDSIVFPTVSKMALAIEERLRSGAISLEWAGFPV